MNTPYFKEDPLQKALTGPSRFNMDKNMEDCIFIRIQNNFRKILFNNILYIEASGSYCNFYLQTDPMITVAYTLMETIQHLPDFLFIRIHRSFIINKKHVTGYTGNVFYIGERMLPIGRQYKREALSHFNILGKID